MFRFVFVFVKYITRHDKLMNAVLWNVLNKLMNAVGIMQIVWSFSKFLKVNNHLQKKYACDVKTTEQTQWI